MNKKEMKVWETLSKTTILNHNKFLSVENHVVKLPDGQIIPDWAWIVTPDAAIVLAVTEEKKFLCFRQTKYAVNGTSLAPAAGMIEPDEIPLETAKRELLEETGYQSSEWVNLGSYVVDPNRGVDTMHLFLALNSKKVSEQHSDDLEEQELLYLSREEIEEALRLGEFKVLVWSTVVSLSLLYLNALERQNAT
jgi:8-oxo-dGTP pyrophosphatase MutT (NUDIX family)